MSASSKNFDDTDYALTGEQLDMCALNQPKVTFVVNYTNPNKMMKRMSKPIIIARTYKAQNGEWFSVEELLNLICMFEMYARPQDPFSSGLDYRNVSFNGIKLKKDGNYQINWAR